MSKKGLYEEIKILSEKKIKEAKEMLDIELSSTVDELSSKTKSENDDVEADYYKYILGQDYDEIVKSTDQELKSNNIDLNKPNLMKSDEGSSTLSTTKIDKVGSDSDSSSFEGRIEKLLIEEKNITYKYEQNSKKDRSLQEIAESTSISAESFISYKTNKLKSVSKLEDQMELLEERLVKLKEQREAEGKQTTKLEEQTKSPKVVAKQTKLPTIAEERTKLSTIAEERAKSPKVAEKQAKSSKMAEERTKVPTVTEEQQKVSIIHKHPQKLEEKPIGKPLISLKEQQEILEVQDIKNKISNERIKQKLNNFLNTSDNILKLAENDENELINTKIETIQLIPKKQTPSRENTPTNIAAMLRETKDTVSEDGNRMRAMKGADSRLSTRSGYSRRISFDSTQHIPTPDMILNEPIEESKVEEEFQINEQLLSRMLEENELMAMKIHQNRFHDDKSVQLSFIDEHIDENIEFSLSDDTMSKKLSCTVVKPITKLFKRKNLSFSDAEVRKIECENKHLESRIRDMMKKGSGLSYNSSAKYCIQASSSINRRKHEAKTCRENLKIERKIRDIKRKSNQKAPWAVPVWI